MSSGLKITPRQKSDIDEQCRWRDPRNEERCPQKAVKRADGKQTAYCEEHAGYSGIVANSLLSPRTIGKWKKLKG